MTVTVAIRGQVREVEVQELTYTDGSPRYVSAGNVALFQKRPGQKLWPAALRFRKEADGTLVPLFQETFLNRAGYRAVAWNDEVLTSKAIERNLSQHNSAQAAKAAADAAEGFTPAEVSEQDAGVQGREDAVREKLEAELTEALAGKADAEANGEALLIGFYSARVEKLKGRLHRLTGNPVKLYDASYKGRCVKVTIPED
jgi:hypothetical protein